jgi:hypothetical protein
MSRITKQIAEEVAKKLVAKKRETLKLWKQVFSEKITKICHEKVPFEVLVVFEKHPKYFKTTNRFRPVGNGWNSQYLDLNTYLPNSNYDYFSFEMEVKTSNALLKEYNKNKDEQKQIDELQRDLVNTLLNLKTYKSVTENFPEAVEHLPKIVNNTVALNLSDIRNRIK